MRSRTGPARPPRPIPADRSGSPGRGRARPRSSARGRRPWDHRAGRPAARPRRRPGSPRSAGSGCSPRRRSGRGLLRLDLLAVMVPREHLGQGDQAHGDRARGRRAGGRGRSAPPGSAGPTRSARPGCRTRPAGPSPGRPGRSTTRPAGARDGRSRRGRRSRIRRPWRRPPLPPRAVAPPPAPPSIVPVVPPSTGLATIGPPDWAGPPRRILREGGEIRERDLERGGRAVHQRRGIVLLPAETDQQLVGEARPARRRPIPPR